MDPHLKHIEEAHKLAMDIYNRCLCSELLEPIAMEINRLASLHPKGLERAPEVRYDREE